MSDIFREVEEDVRREKAQKFWKAWGNYIIALAVLLFAGIGGWQLWQRHDQQQRETLATQFIAAQRISNPRDAASAMSDLSKDAGKGYGLVARLSQANAMVAAGQQKDGVDLYKQIAKDDSGTIGMVARLRAAWVTADTATRSELADLLAPLNQPGNAWRENALEVLAYADYRAMDMKSAQAKYAELAIDPEAPDALRARAKAMAAYLKNGGAVTYGAVPPEVVTAPPGMAASAGAAMPAPAPPAK
ncbi:MAG: tetratricopeptide repeat protein [Alphaproteobacteria bacterium]|nr:tetratricopeptide repeat protein [Alphaproteobacteria bacterium]